MAKYIYRVRLKISHRYISTLARFGSFGIGINADFGEWNQTGDECTAVFTCSDSNQNLRYNRTKEDMIKFVDARFGNHIISTNPRSKIDQNQHIIGQIVEGNPIFKNDSYKRNYDLKLAAADLVRANQSIRNINKSYKDATIKPLKTIKNSSYKKDESVVRIGVF